MISESTLIHQYTLTLKQLGRTNITHSSAGPGGDQWHRAVGTLNGIQYGHADHRCTSDALYGLHCEAFSKAHHEVNG
jgi:hypothetical protein